MSVTVEEAAAHLNLTEDDPDLVELELYVEAANTWVAGKVTDTDDPTTKLATLVLIQHWWRATQLGPATSPVDEEMALIGAASYAIPNIVKTLLGLDISSAGAPTGDFPDAVAWPDPVEFV